MRDKNVSFYMVCNRIIAHAKSFWLPWVLLLGILLTACSNCPHKTTILIVLMLAFVFFLIFKPMNIIYGLLGTHGYIGLFFFLFIVINVLFSGTYYYAFFRDAGITYGPNQPRVEFDLFRDKVETEMWVYSDQTDAPVLDSVTPVEAHYYYEVRFPWVLRNTFLTSLMQEPTDFFSASSTFTGKNQERSNNNFDKAELFQWVLIFHILVSWILLGVFISLIYQKFRNN